MVWIRSKSACCISKPIKIMLDVHRMTKFTFSSSLFWIWIQKLLLSKMLGENRKKSFSKQNLRFPSFSTTAFFLPSHFACERISKNVRKFGMKLSHIQPPLYRYDESIDKFLKTFRSLVLKINNRRKRKQSLVFSFGCPFVSDMLDILNL